MLQKNIFGCPCVTHLESGGDVHVADGVPFGGFDVVNARKIDSLHIN